MKGIKGVVAETMRTNYLYFMVKTGYPPVLIVSAQIEIEIRAAPIPLNRTSGAL